jgi:hypothetical protein
VFIVAVAVIILALIRWIVQTLPLMGAIAALLLIGAAVIALWMKVRKRQSMGSANE